MNVSKAAAAFSLVDLGADMPLINAQSLQELTSDEVFAFRVRACNSLPDRDHERFTVAALRGLAPMFVGRTVIADHNWSSKNQVARIYDAYVEDLDGYSSLVVKCYILRNDSTRNLIDAILGGILREVSVGCAMGRAVCNICGEDYGTCGHRKGDIYDGKRCICELQDPVDAYELSFVAVPAQPGAGVTKSVNGGDVDGSDAARIRLEIEHEKWRFE